MSRLKFWSAYPGSKRRTDGRAESREGLLGVFGAADPEGALAGTVSGPFWHDSCVAVSGVVASDSTGEVIVSGQLTLDNADELRRRFGIPQTDAAAIFAELWQAYGYEACTYALGMYALAVYEPMKQQLFLVRDPVGAKTIYYARNGRAWWFSTRLATLRHSPAGATELSLTALRNYLTFAYVPGCETMWRGITELRPGTAVVIPHGELVTYWEPAQGECDPGETIDDHAERLHDLIGDAVRVRLPEGEPVGVYLSGGVDSSLVTAMAAKYASEPVHTYSLSFGPEYPNELAYAALVAEHCHSIQHKVTVTPREIGEHIWATMAALDDPIGDPLTVPNYMLGKAAAEEVNVVLNGEGGDPCFGGPKNQPMLLHELYGPASSREAAYLAIYSKCFEDLPHLLSPCTQEALQCEASQEALLAPYFANEVMASYLNKLMFINVIFKGADHILTKVNNLTSANHLLGRSPLFDRRVVEQSFAIPPHFKLLGTNEKAVLKQAAVSMLPAPILARPKSGMQVPVQGWFKKDLNRFARSLLLDRHARLRPYINQGVVKQWLDYKGSVWPRYGSKLWLLLSLEIWLQMHEGGA